MTDIQKRFDRILAIYMYMQTKPVVTADELKEKYEVSLRTIYRDIQSLMKAGVPIYSEAGVGYSLVEGYKMRPIQFTQEEALSFVVAEKLVEKYSDKYLSRNFVTALLKMKAVLRVNDREQLAIFDDKFLIREVNKRFNDDLIRGSNTLIESIARKQAVEVYYRKPNSEVAECRELEVVGLFVESKFWYIMAYCKKRKDYRQFRLDRIECIKLLEISFENKHPDLSYFLEKNNPMIKEKVILHVDKKIARFLDWEKDYFGYQHQIDLGEKVEMHFESANVATGFARWFMLFADKAKIIEPASLKTTVRTLLGESTALMETDV